MLETEKQRFLADHLVQSAKDFEETVSATDPGDWSKRTSPDCWSIGEIAEHVLILDNRVAAMAADFAAWPEESYERENCERKDLLVLRVASQRETKLQAPPPVIPSGKLGSAAEFYPGFRAAHERLHAAASGDPAVLRGRFREHPFLKKLDGYQWLLVCSCHRRRHIGQIEDVKKALRG